MRMINLLALAICLTGCMAWPEPIPEYAIESCLRAHGKPVYKSTYNTSEFTCEYPNDLDARYFNDSDLLERKQ